MGKKFYTFLRALNTIFFLNCQKGQFCFDNFQRCSISGPISTKFDEFCNLTRTNIFSLTIFQKWESLVFLKSVKKRIRLIKSLTINVRKSNFAFSLMVAVFFCSPSFSGVKNLHTSEVTQTHSRSQCYLSSFKKKFIISEKPQRWPKSPWLTSSSKVMKIWGRKMLELDYCLL